MENNREPDDSTGKPENHQQSGDEENIEITITEEDLLAASNRQENANQWLSNPSLHGVVPSAMVEARCIKTKRKFFMLFEKIDDHAWNMVRFLDDSWSPSESGQAGGVAIQTNLVSGAINWYGNFEGKPECPYCGGKSFVQCGKCGKITCHVNGEQGSAFQCAWCGTQDYLQGYIKSLDGMNTKSKKGK
jgi:hypothetical protein